MTDLIGVDRQLRVWTQVCRDLGSLGLVDPDLSRLQRWIVRLESRADLWPRQRRLGGAIARQAAHEYTSNTDTPYGAHVVSSGVDDVTSTRTGAAIRSGAPKTASGERRTARGAREDGRERAR